MHDAGPESPDSFYQLSFFKGKKNVRMIQVLPLSYGLCGFHSSFQAVVILLLADTWPCLDTLVVTAVVMPLSSG